MMAPERLRLAFREGVALGEAVWPVLTALPSDQRFTFQKMLTADLATIAAVIGSAGIGLSSEEKAAAAIAGSIISPMITDSVEARKAIGRLKTLADEWESLSGPAKNQMMLEIGTRMVGLGVALTDSAVAASRGLNIEALRQGRESAVLDTVGHAYFRFAQFVAKSDGTVSPAEEDALKKVRQMIYAPAESTPAEKPISSVQEPVPTLDEVLKELDALVGMDNVKASVKALVNFLKVQSERRARNLQQTPISLHAVFRGPPGTGKTTVARLMGKVYRGMGFLKSGHVIETDRAGLVAGYVGQTSGKVDKLVSDALDGILFIDEAYALAPEDSSNDFGREAIDILLKRTEDYRDRLVVIVAGYTEEMNRFLEANPGVQSRFNRYFDFADYSPSDLVEIFKRFCKGGSFVLGQGTEAKLDEILEVLYSKRNRTFGNARLARNLFEKAVERQADRIAGIVPLTDELLTTIEAVDIPTVEGLAG